jgi:hypothetical protein
MVLFFFGVEVRTDNKVGGTRRGMEGWICEGESEGGRKGVPGAFDLTILLITEMGVLIHPNHGTTF